MLGTLTYVYIYIYIYIYIYKVHVEGTCKHQVYEYVEICDTGLGPLLSTFVRSCAVQISVSLVFLFTYDDSS